MLVHPTAILMFMGIKYLSAYLVGSLPFGFILTKIAGKGDIRDIGSGNIGATNVLRTGSKKLAALTLLLDAAKGFLIIFLWQGLTPLSFPNFYSGAAIEIGLFVVIGHCFPIWLKFKGGKGVATTLGVLLAAVPITGLVACLTWLIMAFTFRISSLAALTAAVVAPLVTLFIYGTTSAVICLLITLLVFWRHKENIQRLMKGEEPKINLKKKS